jgi:Sec-independent protein secretion pathway component TatC
MTRYFPGRVGLPPGNVLWVWPWPYGPMESRPTHKVQVRIGDAERDRAIATLGDHFAAGRLTTDEFDERLGQALTARFNEDLEPLFADLPSTAEPDAEPSAQRRSDLHLAWSAMLWLAPLFVMCAIVAAVVLSAPWLLWVFLWVFLITGLFRRRRRYFGPRRYYYDV